MPKAVQLTLLCLLLGIGLCGPVGASATSPATAWVVVQSGTLPLVITAPHGGYDEPAWPVRAPVGNPQQFNLQDDLYTQELAQELAAAVQTQLGQSPNLVVGQVRRRYIDLNRPRELAYGDPVAAPAWQAYHTAISQVLTRLTAQFHRVLLLDIHGHGRQGNPPPLYLGTHNGRTWQALLGHCGLVCTLGPQGLHAQLQMRGYAVPHQVPAHLNGGYTVRHYSQMPGVSAIQVEVPRTLRSHSSRRLQLAQDLALAVKALLPHL
jgi:N-formylglutamate amidohydrolase